MTRLTTQQTQRLERDLLAQRNAVLNEAHEELTRATERSYEAIAGEVPDFGDQATAASLADYDDAIARRHIEVIKEIDDALDRMTTRRFGRCVECDSPVGVRAAEGVSHCQALRGLPEPARKNVRRRRDAVAVARTGARHSPLRAPVPGRGLSSRWSIAASACSQSSMSYPSV